MMGSQAGQSTTTGTNNVYIGYQAGNVITSGASSNNVLIGNTGATTDNATIRIGYNTGGAVAGPSNMPGGCCIGGIYGNTILTTHVPVNIDNTGNLGTLFASSIRYKENVQDIDSSFLQKLRPVTFNYKQDTAKITSYGFIAEEVEKIDPKLVRYKDGIVESTSIDLYYHRLPFILLKEIQKLHKRIEALEAKLT
jgi:hypothetical protein